MSVLSLARPELLSLKPYSSARMEAGRAAARALMEQTGGVFTADLP